MSREEVERRLSSAEKGLEEAAARLESTQRRIEELEQERSSLLGESELARRALSELEQAIAKSREELAAVELEEARQALAEAVQARDGCLREAAAALETALTLLEQLDTHRAAVAEADRRLSSLDPRKPLGRRPAPEEPDLLHEPWQRLVTAVKAQLEEELESDIVDAAARSLASSAIKALPEHLRLLATERRRELRRAAQQRR